MNPSGLHAGHPSTCFSTGSKFCGQGYAPHSEHCTMSLLSRPVVGLLVLARQRSLGVPPERPGRPV